jgi:hypothetical protein
VLEGLVARKNRINRAKIVYLVSNEGDIDGPKNKDIEVLCLIETNA